ncbi:hypothetical protein LEN26_006775 [Aphanomyces euteiches]|nr:hypothetical protein AeMF1_003341 [Aphanomyces euteiches]KAH9134491.1 hypothetical protein LEN26_006775 [Aphanomyces euteiches]KAH9189840.1 hypothetical protein AeNC1_008185 [Aphanomyces euteiches]
MGSVLGKLWARGSRPPVALNAVEPISAVPPLQTRTKIPATAAQDEQDALDKSSTDKMTPLPRAGKTARQILKSVISPSTKNLLAEDTSAEDLLTGSKTSQAFLSYIRNTEETNSKNGSVIENALVFWLTVRDLDFVPEGLFRSVIIAGAYETYIQPHAKREIPIVSNVERQQLKTFVDELQMEDATAILQQISLDALELIRSSFAAFLSDRGPLGFRETRLNKSTLPNFPKDTQGEQREMLEDLLEQPSSCRAFREYFMRIGGCPEFMFLVDVLDYKDTVSALHQESMSEQKQQLHVGYTMRKLRKIYNKYLKAGSRTMIQLEERQREAILLDISKHDIPDPDVFDSAMNSCAYVIILEHLQLFLQSPEYEASKSRRTEPEIHGEKDFFAPTNGLPTIPIPSLPTIAGSSAAKFFRAFLRTQGVESTLDFYLEIEQFKLLPHNKKGYIAAIAGKIFKKYICRGAKLEVYLPSHIRQNILQEIADPQDSTFNEAREYVLGLWERKYLGPFKSSPLCVEMHAHLVQEQKTLEESSSVRQVQAEAMSSSMFRDLLVAEASTHMVQFHKFLVKESCASYSLFYYEIEEFKRLPKSDYLSRQAKKIFYRFLDVTAKEPVSVSSATVADIQVHMRDPSPAMFRPAQDEVFQFLHKVLYPKFTKSPFFADFTMMDKAAEKQGGKDLRSTMSALRKSAVAPTPTLSTSEKLVQHGEITISTILANQDTRAMLLAFCEEIYCAESLYFWLECNEYKSIPHVDYLRVRAQKIYRKYISESAKLQVNLMHSIVREIDRNLAAPSRALFVKAQDAIVSMMGKDTLPKFKASKYVRLQLIRSGAPDIRRL